MLEKVIARQSKAENELYFNSNLQMYNSIKFSHDKTLRKFNKICLLQLSNIELILSKLEKEEYYSKFRSIVKTIINFIQNYEDYNVEYKIYSISDNTIFLALKDNNSNVGEFLNFVNRLYENFQFVRLEDSNEIFVFRFAVVEDEYNLLECGLQTLQKCKELQTYFLVYDREEAMKSDFNHEMEVINILNDAIKNDRVEPYFQGIFDNENKTINKYEALIRIKDADGNIYAPGYFMDIAKKYNIYLNLSKIMINKVFERFRYSDISVSINLSAYDINSKLIQNVIFENLRHCTNNNIIFELLEDECFRDIDMLNDFVAKAKKYNVKIAIDDFGVGYSNFMKIAKISPDFIKIDGSIIKNIDKYEINRKVLKSIVFLGNQLDAELVAEFVENQDVQDILDDLQVHFSQGYFFAKPLCYEDIKSNI